jgi:hypothetical protein
MQQAFLTGKGVLAAAVDLAQDAAQGAWLSFIDQQTQNINNGRAHESKITEETDKKLTPPQLPAVMDHQQ